MIMAQGRTREEWGSISEIVRGKKYRLRYWAETPDGYRRVSETVRGTRRDAYNRLAMRRLEHSADAPCPTVGDAFERWWLPELRSRVESGDMSSSTLYSYMSNWRKWCAPRWESVPMDEVRPLQIQEWLSTMVHNVASRSKVLMTMVMDYGVRYEVIKTNPFRGRYVLPARSTSSMHDKAIWTTEEVMAIWHAVNGTWVEPAIILQAFGGLRLGEALGAIPSDIERESVGGIVVAVVSVVRQLDNSGTITDRLKTEQSRRYVPIPGPAGERLLSLANACTEPYLTGNGVGGHTNQPTYRNSARRLITNAGIEYHPINSLRNSWQTRMRWEWGMAPYMIEPIMGHAVRGVTGKYYDRPTRSMLVQAVVDAYRAHEHSANWD